MLNSFDRTRFAPVDRGGGAAANGPQGPEEFRKNFLARYPEVPGLSGANGAARASALYLHEKIRMQFGKMKLAADTLVIAEGDSRRGAVDQLGKVLEDLFQELEKFSVLAKFGTPKSVLGVIGLDEKKVLPEELSDALKAVNDALEKHVKEKVFSWFFFFQNENPLDDFERAKQGTVSMRDTFSVFLNKLKKVSELKHDEKNPGRKYIGLGISEASGADGKS